MIVVDASVVVELLLNTSAAEAIGARIGLARLHAPELLDLEILQVLRRYRLHEKLSSHRAAQAVSDLLLLRIERHSHVPYGRRIWELHENLTAYEAAYVSLAEVLRAPLITRDARLARSFGHTAAIELIAA